MMTFDGGIICFTKNSNDSLDSKVHYNSADLIKATTIKPEKIQHCFGFPDVYMGKSPPNWGTRPECKYTRW